MGVDLSSKLPSTTLLNRVTQAQSQVAQAVESGDPVAIANAQTQATSQIGQALTTDSFQPVSQAQSTWASSYAASAPSLSGPAAPSAPSAPSAPTAPISATSATSATSPIQFTPQQLAAIGKQVGDSYQSGALPPPQIQFTTQQLNDIGRKVGNDVVESQNVVGGKAGQTNGFDKDSTVIQQSSATDCGAAAVATLRSSKPDKTDVSGEQMEQNLNSMFSSAQGTTPEQMAKMLAHVGLKVTNSSQNLDPNALTSTLQNGGKAVAMVDSNAINPSSQDKGTGNAHWVTIEGMNKNGDYQVKDPSSGRSYYVSPDQLNKAINTVRDTTQSGGLLTVSNPDGVANAQSEDSLAQEGTQEATKLGDAPGTGSNWRNSFGNESS